MKLLIREEFPHYLQQFEELKLVWIGGCPWQNSWDNQRWPTASAHAHYEYGMVCVRNKQCFTKYIMLHEVAHIIGYLRHGYKCIHHNDQWRKIVLELGGTLEERKWSRDYHKKDRSNV